TPAVGYLFWLRKLEYFILFLAAYYYWGRDHRFYYRLISLIKFSVLFHFFFSVLQVSGLLGAFYRDGDYGILKGDSRALSTFSGPYELAAFTVLVSPMFVWGLFRTKHRLSSGILLLSSAVTVA